MAVLSILGLWTADNSIFDLLNVPDGVEKQKVIDNILLQCSEVSFIYSSPNTAKYAIGLWSDKNALTWVKMYETTVLEYNPIENYDRKEDWTDTRQTSGTTNQKTGVTSENTNKVHGFEANAIVTSNITESTGEGTTDSTSNEDATATHTARVHGNIGVTTTQRMLEEQREIAQFNMIDFITKSFQKEFCVMVY